MPQKGNSDKAGSKRNPPGNSPGDEGPSTEELHQLLLQIRDRLDSITSGPPNLLTREEAADVLGISVRKLDELAEAGRIQPTKIDRTVRYHPETLERFVRRCTEGRRS